MKTIARAIATLGLCSVWFGIFITGKPEAPLLAFFYVIPFIIGIIGVWNEY